MVVVVIGGGITGSAAAYKLASLGKKVLLIEKSAVLGGLAGTFQYEEFLLDYGPHKIYTQLPVMEEFKNIMGDILLTVQKKSKLRLAGKYYEYPLQTREVLLKFPLTLSIPAMISALKTMFSKKSSDSYESYLQSRFGNVIYKLVFQPYASKVWGDPKKLSPDVAKSRVAGAPSIFALIKNMIFGTKGKELSAKTFYYPKHGVSEMSETLANKMKKMKGKILLNSYVESIQVQNSKITSIHVHTPQGKKMLKVEAVVSTLPLSTLLSILWPQDKQALAISKELPHRDLLLLYLFVDKERILKENWLFFPEYSFSFNRLSEQKGFSPYMGPSHKTVLCVEVTKSEVLSLTDTEVYSLVLNDLEHVNVLSSKEVSKFIIKRIPKVYQIYDIQYKERIENICKPLDKIQNIYSIGRQGAFTYVGTMDCIDMSFKTAEFICSNKSRNEWIPLRRTFHDYEVID